MSEEQNCLEALKRALLLCVYHS